MNDPHPALDGATTALQKRIEELTAALESKTRESFSWESDYRGLEDKCRERDDKFEAAESEVARLREERETLRLAVEAGRLLIATERAAREQAEADRDQRIADLTREWSAHAMTRQELKASRAAHEKAMGERDTALERVKELERACYSDGHGAHAEDLLKLRAAESALASLRTDYDACHRQHEQCMKLLELAEVQLREHPRIHALVREMLTKGELPEGSV